MSIRNSIIDNLSEGMLSNLSTSGDVFSSIVKNQKLPNSFSTKNSTDGNWFSPTAHKDVVIKILNSNRAIASKKVGNVLFQDCGGSNILVVFLDLPIPRALLINTLFDESTALKEMVSVASKLPSTYKGFKDIAESPKSRLYLLADVMFDIASNFACLNFNSCVHTFFTKWFKLYGTKEFNTYFVDSKMSLYLDVEGVHIASSASGEDWIGSFLAKVTDLDRFNEIKDSIKFSNELACYSDSNGVVNIDFYII